MAKRPTETATPADQPVATVRRLDNGLVEIIGVTDHPDDRYTATNATKARSWLRSHGYDPDLVPDAEVDPVTPPNTTPEPPPVE